MTTTKDAPLDRTTIARIWREVYGSPRFDASAELFAQKIALAALASKQADSRTQHDIDSAELRRLCAERDEMRRANSLQMVEVAGLESSVGHLGALVDDLRRLLADALRSMKALHESATPEDTEAMDAIVPAAAFRQFVDDHAALLYAVKHSAHDGFPPKQDEAKLAATPAEPAQPAAPVVPQWLPIESAPRDGTSILLLIEGGELPLQDDSLSVSIGAYGVHGGPNEDPTWDFAGWSWHQDCYCRGDGKPVGWMPRPDTTVAASAAQKEPT